MQINVNLAKIAGWITLGLGILSLITSVIYDSQILAFIGLGLTLWGIILIYIRTEDYVKESLLSATSLSTLATLNQIIDELGHKEKAIYLPPKYLKNPENNRAYIPKSKISKLPQPEQIQAKEDKLFIENPQGILITPPGSELARLFEKTLETSFTRVDLRYLQLNLPKLFIEELEIAQNLEINAETNKVHVKIENSTFQNLTKEIMKFSKLYENLGCPLSSAIACALTKAIGKPITIEKQETDEKNKTIEIEYQIIEEEQT
ncbi:MAG: hypothetical protein QXL57_09215 [Candidatus Bathyarchaeia archaeon]